MSRHINLADLIQQLTELSEELAHAGHDSRDVLVKLHTQSHYPIKASIANVTVLVERGERPGQVPTYHVALADGGTDHDENPYGDRAAWEHHDELPDLDEDDSGDYDDEEG